LIRITFLGTAASRPTVGRNVSSLSVQREGDLMLFDCGEGTQRQMMRYQTGFGLGSIFITHLHADHFLGIIGLLRTMSLQGRMEPIEVYGPRGSRKILEAAVTLGVERVGFPVDIHEMEIGERINRGDYDILAFSVAHGRAAVGYALIEHDRLGRFDPDHARALGVPEGPLFGKLHRGEPITVDGRTILPSEVVGPPRAGRRVVYTGDTGPSPDVVDAARRCDVLVHDCTFGDEETDRARETGHSTAADAGRVAREAGARRLILTHISARYADAPALLEREASVVYRGAKVAYDGMVIEIPYEADDKAAEAAVGAESGAARP
jgi:ribonuclease Z